MFSDDRLQPILALNHALDAQQRATLEELRRLLRACFQASLQTEEGRPTRFNVAFVEPAAPSFPQQETPQWWLLQFEQPRNLTGPEFAKLAQANDLRSAFIGVRRAAKEPDELAIWGILVVGPSTWRMRTGRTKSSSEYGARYFTVQVVGPGNLVVGNGVQFIRLIGDEAQDEHSVNLFALCGRPSSIFVRDFMGEYWARTISLLLQWIVVAGHGGTLFILDSASIPDRLDVKYALQSCTHILPDTMGPVETAEASAKVGYQPSGDPNRAVATIALNVQDWDTATECVGRLALVDGAVLLTRDLKVVGFGTFVRQLGTLETVQVKNARDIEATNRDQYDVGAKGTRHRAAVAFCSQNPDAIAFIVSQDGGISAMRSIEDVVLIWHIDLGVHGQLHE